MKLDYKNLQWCSLTESGDSYLLVAVNYIWCNKPDIDRLIFEKFGQGFHTSVETHMSSSNVFLYELIVSGKIGQELPQEVRDYIEEVFEEYLGKYKEYYYSATKG